MFETRRLVEAAAMEPAAERALPRGLDAARETVREEHAAFERSDLRQWMSLSGRGHLRLLALAKNGVLGEVAATWSRGSLLMTALYMPPGQASCASHEHDGLIDAVAAGKGKRAARLMGAHLLACEARLRLDAPEEAAPDLAAALGRPAPPPDTKGRRTPA